jgi:hypothetical protein
MAVSKRLRYEILRRDNHACRYCGRSAPDVPLTVDHVIPIALAGSDDASNLVTACGDCNSGKSASSANAAVVQDVDQRALRWATAMRDAGECIIGTERIHRDRTRAAFVERWTGWTYTHCGESVSFPLPTSWPITIDALVRAGLLGREDIVDCVDETMYRDGVSDRWRYFCGMCWRLARRVTDIALGLVGDIDPAPKGGG